MLPLNRTYYSPHQEYQMCAPDTRFRNNGEPLDVGHRPVAMLKPSLT